MLANRRQHSVSQNIFEYPTPRQNVYPNREVTIGDLHGNPLKLIFALVQEGMMDLQLEAEDYNTLANICSYYFDKSQELKYNPSHKFSTLGIHKLKQKKKEFIAILNRASFNTDVVRLLRLVGDEVADRGPCDGLTFLLLNKLNQINIRYEIMESNHGFVFTAALQYQFSAAIRETYRLDHVFENSLLFLQCLMQQGVFSYNEINQLAEVSRNNKLKLISYSETFMSEINRHKLTILSHAAIDLDTLADYAIQWKIAHEPLVSAAAIKDLIDKINKVYQEHLQQKTTIELLPPDFWMANVIVKHPLLMTIWHRKQFKLNRPALINETCAIDYVHGHDMGDEVLSNVFMIDDTFGKSWYKKEGGPMRIFESQEVTPLLTQIAEVKDAMVQPILVNKPFTMWQQPKSATQTLVANEKQCYQMNYKM